MGITLPKFGALGERQPKTVTFKDAHAAARKVTRLENRAARMNNPRPYGRGF